MQAKNFTNPNKNSVKWALYIFKVYKKSFFGILLFFKKIFKIRIKSKKNSDLQLGFDVLGLEHVDLGDEVRLLDASPAVFSPVVQDLPQLLHSHLLQVHLRPVDLLLVFEVADLCVPLFQFLADDVDGHVVRKWSRDLIDHGSGCILCGPDVVTKSVVFSLGGFTLLPQENLDVVFTFHLFILHFCSQLAEKLLTYFAFL